MNEVEAEEFRDYLRADMGRLWFKRKAPEYLARYRVDGKLFFTLAGARALI